MHRFTILTLLCLLGVGSFLLSAGHAATARTADDRLSTAQNLLNTRQDQQAAVELQGFLDAYPTDPRAGKAAYLLGNCYQHLEKYDKAILAYQLAVTRSPGAKGEALRGQAYYYLADCYFAQQALEKAAREYGNALKLLSGDAELSARARYWMGESFYQLEHYDQALSAYRKVVETAPKHELAPWSLYSIGMIELHGDQFAAAIDDLKRVTTEYKQSEVAGEATLALGFAYLERAQKTLNDKTARASDYHQALDFFHSALDDGKVTPSAKQRAMLAMAQADFDLQQYGDAEAICARALETVKPDDPLAHRLELWRGHALYYSKNYHDAVIAYSSVANCHSPELVNEALYWLGSSWYQMYESSKEPKASTEASNAFGRFLTNVDEKNTHAATAALLQAYCIEDLAKDAAARAKAVAAYRRIVDKWPTSREASQAQNGIVRLTSTMTIEELKPLVGNLPGGTGAWNAELRLAYEEYQAAQPKYDAVIAAARKVLDGKPGAEITAQAWCIIGAAQQKTGKLPEAITSYQQVLAGTPGADLAIFAQRGLVQAQLELKHYEEARDAALALAKLPLDEKNQSEAQMYLGNAYFGTQQMTEAQDCYQKIMTAYPTSPQASYALMCIAWIAETKKDLPRAVASYRDFLSKFPDDAQVPQAMYRLGVDLVDNKEYEKAIQAFQNVPKTWKFADEAAYAIAWAYHDLGKMDEANDQFAAVAKEYPNSPLATDSLFRLGEYWLEQKNYTQAMLNYNLASDKSPRGSLGELTLYKLGVCAFHAEQYQAAANAFGKLIGNYKDGQYEAESLYWRGQSLEKLAQYADARGAYGQYVDRFAKQPLMLDAALGAGRCALRAKQYADARTDMTRALQLCADTKKATDKTLDERAKNVAPEAQYDLAQSYFEEKHYTDALKAYAGVSAYKYEPWYSQSMLQMARCSAELGDREAAQTTLRLLLRNFPKSDAVKDVPTVVKDYGLDLGPMS